MATARDTVRIAALGDRLGFAAPEFDATLKTITIRGTTFADVKFNFPKGNDKD